MEAAEQGGVVSRVASVEAALRIPVTIVTRPAFADIVAVRHEEENCDGGDPDRGSWGEDFEGGYLHPAASPPETVSRIHY